MTKQLFERKLEWGNPTRALRFGALLVAMQVAVAFGAVLFRSATAPIESPVFLRLFRGGEYVLVGVAVLYGMDLIRSANGRERWVGVGVVACSVVSGLSMLWLV